MGSLIKWLVEYAREKSKSRVNDSTLVGRWLDLLGDESSSEHHHEHQQSKTDYGALDESADLGTREH